MLNSTCDHGAFPQLNMGPHCPNAIFSTRSPKIIQLIKDYMVYNVILLALNNMIAKILTIIKTQNRLIIIMEMFS